MFRSFLHATPFGMRGRRLQGDSGSSTSSMFDMNDTGADALAFRPATRPQAVQPVPSSSPVPQNAPGPMAASVSGWLGADGAGMSTTTKVLLFGGLAAAAWYFLRKKS